MAQDDNGVIPGTLPKTPKMPVVEVMVDFFKLSDACSNRFRGDSGRCDHQQNALRRCHDELCPLVLRKPGHNGPVYRGGILA